jgi:hypothetical protein
LAAERGIDVNNPSNIDADGYPLDLGKIIKPYYCCFMAAYSGSDAAGFLRDFCTYPELGGKIQWIDAL